MNESRELTDPIKTLEYVNSAKSAITLKSLRTGLEIDYAIKREIVDDTGDMDTLWIRADIRGSWHLIGRIDCEIFSALRPDSWEAKAFRYFWKALQAGELAAGIKVTRTIRRRQDD